MAAVTTALAPVADWWLNLLITYGPVKVTAVAGLILLAIWCALGALAHAHDTLKRRRQEASQ